MPKTLSYQSAGVDMQESELLLESIKEAVKATYNKRILTQSGMFAGAIRLDEFKTLEQPSLYGVMGHQKPYLNDYQELVFSVIEDACQNFPAKATPLAFLDYLASSSVKASEVERWIKTFSNLLAPNPSLPLLGGDTAEMPGVFQDNKWEVVASLMGIGEKAEVSALSADLSMIKDFSSPALVLSMDGVGTKTRLALKEGHLQTLLEDLVNHSLNDILCLGAQGVGITIYVACHQAKPHWKNDLEQVLPRLPIPCIDFVFRELPYLYNPGELDICACIAGVVDTATPFCTQKIEAGDQVIGIASNGLHTNGYSLAYKALFDKEWGNLSAKKHFDILNGTLADALLLTHKSYAESVLPILKTCKGVAHITGGGIADNLTRILPLSMQATIEVNSWNVPSIFSLIQKYGNIPLFDPKGKGMYEVFNMGVGMVLIVDKASSKKVIDTLNSSGNEAFVMGSLSRKDENHESVTFI